jgi:hypothetical protein
MTAPALTHRQPPLQETNGFGNHVVYSNGWQRSSASCMAQFENDSQFHAREFLIVIDESMTLGYHKTSREIYAIECFIAVRWRRLLSALLRRHCWRAPFLQQSLAWKWHAGHIVTRHLRHSGSLAACRLILVVSICTFFNCPTWRSMSPERSRDLRETHPRGPPYCTLPNARINSQLRSFSSLLPPAPPRPSAK